MGNWDKIKGQDRLIKYFCQAGSSGNMSHAYILEGEAGAPKMELARAFARMLLCEEGTGCGHCHSCLAFDSGNHPDVIYVSHEKAEVIRIDEIRQQLIDDISIKPYSSKYKIYIVDEAEKMNAAAENALLKTLEEPPHYAMIMLLTSNADGFLPTILSRSMRIALGNSGNSGPILAEEDRELVLKVIRTAGDMDRVSMVQAAAEWKKAELAASSVLELLRLYLRDILIIKSGGTSGRLGLSGESGYVRKASEKYSYRQVNDILLLADQTEKRIASNVNYELAMELLLAAMRYPEKKPQIADEEWADIPLPSDEEIEFYNNEYYFE